ncbi:hypothetical protein R3W88_004659 [Solanum pinnatisectum]|uniref:Major facilitator superfamily (MFS) profile domain-containing protein n=1 Tax=Solanum pinnatisectum TaxID=50273 RepID=A0AAV9K9X7_9SOLN|nr:hypothetical protein R3W88_004659 [Solanum pinnatisectum]
MLKVKMNNSKITLYVVSCWIFAAFGVSAMDDFLIKFFPHVYQTKLHAKENNYCKYDNWLLQLFTASLYISALVASFFASKAATKLGRRTTILIASIFFIVGAVLSAAAENKLRLIFGRILFGVGLHQSNTVNIMFQLFMTIGIFIANLNYGTSMIHRNGWRMSLGFAAIPAVILLFGSFVITDTPTSLVERGNEEQGKASLMKIRGVSDVEAEYKEIVACEQAKQVKHSLKNLLKPASIPPLVIGVLLQIFQQINAIMFYAPLLSSVITEIVNVSSTFVSIYLVDKVGRRKLLLQACCQILFEIGTLDRTLAIIVVLLVCTYVMSFPWSWGPLGWLIPSEPFPLETRTIGFAFAVSTNMLFTSIIAQLFLTMLCTMKAYIFFFFSRWIVVMGLFVFFFLPETKRVPIDSMVERVWMQQPIWKRLF